MSGSTTRVICDEYLKIYPEEAHKIQKLLDQIRTKGESTLGSNKEFDEGHLTAAGFIVSQDYSRVLLVEHNLMKKRLQPGGHVEPEDTDLISTALREIAEETGLSADQLTHVPLDKTNTVIPIDIDIHPIPPRPNKNEPAHYHYDFRYLFIVKDGSETTVNYDELDGIVWAPWEEFAANPEFALPAKKIKNLLK